MSLRRFFDRIVSRSRRSSTPRRTTLAGRRAPRFEPLEQRRLLSLTPVIDASLGDGNGMNNNEPDAFLVARNGDNIEVYIEETFYESYEVEDLESLTINGSGDNDTVTIEDLGSDFAGIVTVDAVTGTDTAYVYDSTGNDECLTHPNQATMNYGSDATIEITVNNFDAVTAYSTNGGTDTAELYDSAGNDTFIGKTWYSVLSGSGYSTRVEWFESVEAHADNGGTDTANLYDSMNPILYADRTVTGYDKGIVGVVVEADLPAEAVIDASDFQFKVYSGSSWVAGPTPDDMVINYEKGTSGTDQIVFVWDDDSIVDQWLEITVLASGDVGVANDEMLYFGSLRGDANADGAASAGDLSIVGANWGEIDGGVRVGDFNLDGFVNDDDLAILDENWQAILLPSQPTSSQVIDGYLFHRFTSDEFFASPIVASMDYDNDASKDIRITNFKNVHAYSLGGNDTAGLNGSEDNDLFSGEPGQSSLQVDGTYYNEVIYFDEVIVDMWQGGTDTALMHHQEGTDDVLAVSHAGLFIEMNYNYGDGTRELTVCGAELVKGYSSLDDNDWAILKDKEDSDDTFWGYPNLIQMDLGSDSNIELEAHNFRYAQGQSVYSGGSDTAYFYGTVANGDWFSGGPTVASMQKVDTYYYDALGFDQLIVDLSQGGNDICHLYASEGDDDIWSDDDKVFLSWLSGAVELEIQGLMNMSDTVHAHNDSSGGTDTEDMTDRLFYYIDDWS